jgi:hypothetical protein
VPRPWERQTLDGAEEPSRAFHAFCFYRDLGSQRSLEKVSVALSAARGRPARGQNAAIETAAAGGGKRRVSKQIEEWSKRWKWVERVRGWEDEQDRLKREAFSKEIEEMGKRHAQQAMGAGQILSLPFMAAARRLKAVQNDLGELERLPLAELLKLSVSSAMFLSQMHKAEREARGVDSLAPAGRGGRVGAAGGDTPTAAPVTVTGAEFAWVQGRCTCGHTHSLHNQQHEDPSRVPCTVEGCKCQKYRDVDDAAEAGDQDDDD